MIREHIFSSRTPTDPHFRWRGGDVSRLEGLSDAAFAFAMTMMVVSSFQQTKTWDGVLEGVMEVPALIACFSILIWIWGLHYRYFRRFGLEDVYTIFLNSALLLTVMVYVYPLKFIFTALLTWQRKGESPWGDWTGAEVLQLYGIGYILIFVLLALMLRHAYGQRERLQLDELETFLTRASFRDHLLSASVGVVSIAITLIGPKLIGGNWSAAIAGMSYALNGPVHWWHGVRVGKQIEVIESRMNSAE